MANRSVGAQRQRHRGAPTRARGRARVRRTVAQGHVAGAGVGRRCKLWRGGRLHGRQRRGRRREEACRWEHSRRRVKGTSWSLELQPEYSSQRPGQFWNVESQSQLEGRQRRFFCHAGSHGEDMPRCSVRSGIDFSAPTPIPSSIIKAYNHNKSGTEGIGASIFLA